MRALWILLPAAFWAGSADALTWTFLRTSDESPLLTDTTFGSGISFEGSFDFDTSLAGNAAVTDLDLSIFGTPAGDLGPGDLWEAFVTTTGPVTDLSFRSIRGFHETVLRVFVNQSTPENSLGEVNAGGEVLFSNPQIAGAPPGTGQVSIIDFDYTEAFETRDFSIPPIRTFAATTDAKLVNLSTFPPEEPAPLLPDRIDEDGGFEFVIDPEIAEPEEIFFIDPEITTGYDYSVVGSTFFSVQAPTLEQVADGDGLYALSFGATDRALAAGELFAFPEPVTAFSITGIDPALMLDPTDELAFVTGVSLTTLGPGITITQTPLTESFGDDGGGAPPGTVVPLPGAAAGLVLGVGALAGARLRRRRAARAPSDRRSA